MAEPRIVIVGGGFAGVKCARVLSRTRSGLDLVMFNPANYMVFTPLLADVAGSALNPRAITAPLRQMLKRVRCRAEEVTSVEPPRNRISYSTFDGTIRSMDYDELVLAVGNRVDLGRVPGMVTHALPLKSIGDAMSIRVHVMERLEQADACDDPELKRWLTSFVVIGGGFSGVEVAGEINDLARHSLKYYPGIAADDLKITLIHSRDQILPEVGARLRDFALERMRRHRVDFVLEARAAAVTRTGVRLDDGRTVQGGTIVCTIGNTAGELIERLDLPKEHGRLKTAPDLRVEGTENVWAVGDCALIPNAHDGGFAPPTAQFAEREGAQAARNILRKLKARPTRPFKFKPVGVAASIGGHRGVAELLGVRVSGFFAFWLWRSAFLIKLPSVLQKLKVGLNWAWETVFPREISAFSVAKTQPVARGFFAAGETVIDGSTGGNTMYAIERGECEIVELRPPRQERVLAVIGRGELIGPHTLASYRADHLILRAREHTEVISLAGDFLERISGALKPVETMLKRAMLTHRPYWAELPQAEEALEAVSAYELMRPPPALELDPALPSLAAFARLREVDQPLAFVLIDQKLVGMVTRTDLIAGLERGPKATVDDVMTRDPACACAGEPALLAAHAMRDRGFKWLPVIADRGSRQLVGVLHAEDLLAHVLGKLPG